VTITALDKDGNIVKDATSVVAFDLEEE